MTTEQRTPSMQLAHLQSALHWLFPMRHSREHGLAVRAAILNTVRAGKVARATLKVVV